MEDKDKIRSMLMKLPGYSQSKIEVAPGRLMDKQIWRFVPD